MASTISGSPRQITASGNVCAIPGVTLIGIFVSSASNTPTITVYDDAGTGTTVKVVDTFTPTGPQFYPLYISARSGFNVVLGGTVSATVVLG